MRSTWLNRVALFAIDYRVKVFGDFLSHRTDIYVRDGPIFWPQWDRLALWRGASLLRSGRVESALLYLEAQLKRYPMNGELYGLAGRAARALGCFELARTRFVFACAHLLKKSNLELS